MKHSTLATPSSDLFFLAFAKRHAMIITNITKLSATVLYHEAPPAHVLQELRRHLSVPLHLTPLDASAFKKEWAAHYPDSDVESQTILADMEKNYHLNDVIHSLPTLDNEVMSDDHHAPIIRLINALIREALDLHASDIHMETFSDAIHIRFRVDGLLQPLLEIPKHWRAMLASRIKIMAKLDIAEKRLPQDGRFSMHSPHGVVDVRVATLPTHSGERIVLRLLHNKSYFTSLEHLGLRPHLLKQLHQLIHKTHGMILVTGPTGSGKTTTLYAALGAINNKERNILTVEDPIEYSLTGISQIPVNPKIAMDFARGLRAILRQDPDVVMVGEIRDEETARIAVQASLTGHLVFSSLHTNTAVGAITRLRDMGVAPYLLASSLIGIVAQRLIRLLCQGCEGHGCQDCLQRGYKGRTAVYEMITVDETLRTLIHDQASEQVLQAYCHEHFESIEKDAAHRYEQGETTLEEIQRVLYES